MVISEQLKKENFIWSMLDEHADQGILIVTIKAVIITSIHEIQDYLLSHSRN